jgi:hypothetical protein
MAPFAATVSVFPSTCRRDRVTSLPCSAADQLAVDRNLGDGVLHGRLDVERGTTLQVDVADGGQRREIRQRQGRVRLDVACGLSRALCLDQLVGDIEAHRAIGCVQPRVGLQRQRRCFQHVWTRPGHAYALGLGL